MKRVPARVAGAKPATIALSVILLLSCGGEPPEQEQEPLARPNVIMIVVDAMRPDRLGPYGFTQRPTTPNLDAVAARGVVFENAVSQAGWTVPSIGSLFTAVYPKTHGALKFIDPKAHSVTGDADGPFLLESLSAEHDTIAEQLRNAGWETAAILKSDVVNAGRGFDQGFDHFEFVDRRPKERGESGGHLTDATIAWLDGRQNQDQPFYLYLHYMDPHATYQAPKPLYDKYSAGIESELDGSVMQVRAFNDGTAVPTDEDVAKLLALYDAEIEYWDSQLGRLVAALEASGDLANTYIVVTADHGEAFNEHGRFLHAGLFQENIRVPVIIAGPGTEARRIGAWVEMISLGPTVVELAGAPASDGWMVPSLAEVVRGHAEPQERPVFSEWAGLRCVIEPPGLKLLVTPKGTSLFDLVDDPGETIDLASERLEDVARLRLLLDEQEARSIAHADNYPVPEAQPLTDEQVEDLRALGYLGD